MPDGLIGILKSAARWAALFSARGQKGLTKRHAGFANAVVSPAIEFKAEGFVTGMAAKMFIIAGPVIVYGTVASVLYGLILVIFGG